MRQWAKRWAWLVVGAAMVVLEWLDDVMRTRRTRKAMTAEIRRLEARKRGAA